MVGGQAPKAIRSVECYDFEEDRWDQIAELPSRRCRAGEPPPPPPGPAAAFSWLDPASAGSHTVTQRLSSSDTCVFQAPLPSPPARFCAVPSAVSSFIVGRVNKFRHLLESSKIRKANGQRDPVSLTVTSRGL